MRLEHGQCNEVVVKTIEFANYPKFMHEYLLFLRKNPNYINLDPLEVLAQLGINSARLLDTRGSYAHHQNDYHQISDEDYTWFLLKWL
jgi:hypothetical protein